MQDQPHGKNDSAILYDDDEPQERTQEKRAIPPEPSQKALCAAEAIHDDRRVYTTNEAMIRSHAILIDIHTGS